MDNIIDLSGYSNNIIDLSGYSIQECKAILKQAKKVFVLCQFVGGGEWFNTTKVSPLEWLDNYCGVTMSDPLRYNETRKIMEVG